MTFPWRARLRAGRPARPDDTVVVPPNRRWFVAESQVLAGANVVRNPNCYRALFSAFINGWKK